MLNTALDINLIWFVLAFFTLWMVIFGGLVNSYLEKYIPRLFSDAFRYGKTLRNDSSHYLIRFIEVPKSYFLHFYIFATVFISFLLYRCVDTYLLGNKVPRWMINSLDVLGTAKRANSTSPEGTLLAMSLLTLQVWRRLYECMFVNAASNSRMNILHYIVGYVHYFCAGAGILSEAAGFANNGPFDVHFNQGVKHTIEWLHLEFNWQMVTLVQTVSCLIFLWAWKHQYITHKIFANLKKQLALSGNKSSHSIPHGDWFYYVSCPHYLAEILMYACISVILGIKHKTGIIIFSWVLINQVIAGLMSHYWYLERYSHTYPKNRKAIIPFFL